MPGDFLIDILEIPGDCQWQAPLEAALPAYEPRIPAVDVEVLSNDDSGGGVMNFEMTCHLEKVGLERFGTHFEPRGCVRLSRRQISRR